MLALANVSLLARTSKGDHTFRWGIYDRAPLKTWSTERMTLLGDAANALPPHLGQGANQAVDDAITLAVLLQDAQAERIVAINDRLKLDTHDAERIANDALAAL